MPPETWILIFQIVADLLAQCRERRADVEQAIKTPTGFQKRIFEARLRRHATSPFFGIMTRQEWRENEADILDHAYGFGARATPEELNAIIDG